MKKLSLLLAMLMVMCLLASCSSLDEIRLGTAGSGGSYYLFGKSYASHVTKDTDLRIRVKETAGSAANLRLLAENYLQAAIAQEDLIEDALKQGMSGYRAIASLYTEYCQIIVKEDSSITKISDLRGKIVSFGEAESGTEQNASEILSAYGISEKLLSKKNMSYKQAANALKEGEIDAMIVTAGIQTEIVESLAKEAPVRLLPIDGEALQILTDSYDFFEANVIPAGTYTGQKEDVQTIGMESVLIVHETMTEDDAYKLTKELFNHLSEIQQELPFKLKPGLNGITIPLHAGAEKYYTEEGYDIPDRMRGGK